MRPALLQVLALVLSGGRAALGLACAGDERFWCAGPAQVLQCVQGRALGPPTDCGPGLFCDAAAEWGPCNPHPQDACCAEGIFPVKGNCRVFMSCVSDGVQLLRFFGACASGFAFNPSAGRCVEAGAASDACWLDEVELSTAPTPAPSVTSTTPAPNTTTARTSTTPTTTTTTGKPPRPVCSSPGIHVDPGSCRHYYMCSWAAGGGVTATRTPCAKNLFFDATLRQCVFTTNCGARPK